MFTIISFHYATSTTKSESLKQLAAACARKNPNKRYLVVDADPQGTLTNWYALAPDAIKPFDVVPFGDHEAILNRYDGVFYDSEGKPPEDVQKGILGASEALIFIPMPTTKHKLYTLTCQSAISCLKATQNFFTMFVLVSDSQDLSVYRQYTKAWVGDSLLDTHIPAIDAIEEVHNAGSLPQFMPKGHASRSILGAFDNAWLEVEKLLGQLEVKNQYALQNA